MMGFSYKAFFFFCSGYKHTRMSARTGCRVRNNLLFSMTIELQSERTHWLQEPRVRQREQVYASSVHMRKTQGSLYTYRGSRPSDADAFLTSITRNTRFVHSPLWVMRLCLKGSDPLHFAGQHPESLSWALPKYLVFLLILLDQPPPSWG